MAHGQPNLVQKFHVLDPETERIVDSGHDLKDGMVVLIENDHVRTDLAAPVMSQQMMNNAMRWNRWMTVTQLDKDGPFIEFVGVYEDGVEKHFVLSADHSWYVKIPRI